MQTEDNDFVLVCEKIKLKYGEKIKHLLSCKVDPAIAQVFSGLWGQLAKDFIVDVESVSLENLKRMVPGDFIIMLMTGGSPFLLPVKKIDLENICRDGLTQNRLDYNAMNNCTYIFASNEIGEGKIDRAEHDVEVAIAALKRGNRHINGIDFSAFPISDVRSATIRCDLFLKSKATDDTYLTETLVRHNRVNVRRLMNALLNEELITEGITVSDDCLITRDEMHSAMNAETLTRVRANERLHGFAIVEKAHQLQEIYKFQPASALTELPLESILDPVPASLVNSDEACSICFEDSNPKVMLQCGHVFDHQCISNALREKESCPNCRSEIKVTKRGLAFPPNWTFMTGGVFYTTLKVFLSMRTDYLFRYKIYHDHFEGHLIAQKKGAYTCRFKFFGERIVIEGTSGYRSYINSSDFMAIIKWLTKNYKTFTPWSNKIAPAIPRNDVAILSTLWSWKNVVYADKYNVITDICGYNSWYAYDGNFVEYVFSWQNGTSIINDMIVDNWKDKMIPASVFSRLKKAIWSIGATQYYAAKDLDVKFDHEGPADIVIRDNTGKIVCGILITHKSRVRINANFKFRGYFEWSYDTSFFSKLSTLCAECVFLPLLTDIIWRVAEIVRYVIMHMVNESDAAWYDALLPGCADMIRSPDALLIGNCYLNYLKKNDA